jgi:hypothetical protein
VGVGVGALGGPPGLQAAQVGGVNSIPNPGHQQQQGQQGQQAQQALVLAACPLPAHASWLAKYGMELYSALDNPEGVQFALVLIPEISYFLGVRLESLRKMSGAHASLRRELRNGRDQSLLTFAADKHSGQSAFPAMNRALTILNDWLQQEFFG